MQEMLFYFFNFRTDRGRELTQMLSQKAFPDQATEPLRSLLCHLDQL